jgi:hypothetical protein
MKVKKISTRYNDSKCPYCGSLNGCQPLEFDCHHLVDMTYDEKKGLYYWYYAE